jgi:hypothetical protein
VHDTVSISAGQFHYETDGFRDNNDLEKDIYNIFIQSNISHKASIQAEFRYIDTENGDLNLDFDKDDFLSELRFDEETYSARLGFRTSVTPNSDLIASFIYENFDATLDGFLDFRIDTDAEGYLAEFQHIYRSKVFKVITGAGHSSDDQTDDTTDLLFNTASTEEFDVKHNNLYIYTLINYPEPVTLTVGGSFDLVDSEMLDSDRFNPKFGLLFNPLPGTTLRAAAFKTVTKILPTQQTIEPTQVSGFNQFFDEGQGTEYWRYGIAVDQKFTNNLFAGAEYSEREIDVPFRGISSAPPPPPPPPPAPSQLQPPPPPPPPPPQPVSEILHTDWDEELWRTYIYWTPHPWVAASGELFYENLEREAKFGSPGGFTSLRTYKLKPAVNVFHPSGLIAKLEANYVDQEGNFGDPINGFSKGEDNFWVVNASIGYRLPKRYGIVSLEVKNLFDESFNFQEMESSLPRLYPERLVFARFTLSF